MYDDYEASTYGDRTAGDYEEIDAVPDYETEFCVERLTALAGPGPVLELGVGTGRVALQLARKGFAVHGVDASDAMLARLLLQPDAERIRLTHGDLLDPVEGGPFTLIYIVFNTFFMLRTQDEQLRCFATVAEMLDEHGVFVIEAFLPNMARLANDHLVHASQIATGRVRMDVEHHDLLSQRIFAQRMIVEEGRTRLYPVQFRYAWPSELDLMARLHGLRLRERRGGWLREMFTSESRRHVSIYERQRSRTAT